MEQAIEKFIEAASGLKVLLIGETITDKFIEVSYEGQSMKSFCPAFKLAGEEHIHLGGTYAIYRHIKDFVKQIDLVSNPAEEIIKTRYVDVQDCKKHVEINKFDLSNTATMPDNIADYDCVIIADFGHSYCDDLQVVSSVHLMCQTNSNNFGFNRMSKWKTTPKKSVCIDLREASLQMNSRFKEMSDQQAKALYEYELNTENLVVTLGKKGALLYDGQSVHRGTSFKSNVVDTIGAGDAFYGFMSLCLELDEITPEEKMIIPALAASLSTTWLGNEKNVTPELLKAHAARQLQ